MQRTHFKLVSMAPSANIGRPGSARLPVEAAGRPEVCRAASQAIHGEHALEQIHLSLVHLPQPHPACQRTEHTTPRAPSPPAPPPPHPPKLASLRRTSPSSRSQPTPQRAPRRAPPTRAPYACTHRGHSRALEQPVEVRGRLGPQQQRDRVHVREHSLERLLGFGLGSGSG